ncbi:MAG: ECF-type sigma factor [Planctomycetota bacterium]|nr:ECF-type sigma factor [Planctomycetota bacterium]
MDSTFTPSTALQRLKSGEQFSLGELLPYVYGELKGMARAQMRHQRANHTLQASALVNAVYLKLERSPIINWEGREHFFASAARAMRQVLIDHARTANRAKRGGDMQRRELRDDRAEEQQHETLDLLILNEALEKLGQEHERKEQVVEMRYFAGLSEQEIAEVLGVSTKTVERDWAFAQAWLARELR